MKSLLRHYLINLTALWATTQIIPALVIEGGIRGLLIGSLAFMAANIFLVPLLKILLLPLNLLTLGLFAWLSNVLVLYFLVTVLPYLKLLPYNFSGANFNGFIIPPYDLSIFQAAIVVSFLIGLIIHSLSWLSK